MNNLILRVRPERSVAGGGQQHWGDTARVCVARSTLVAVFTPLLPTRRRCTLSTQEMGTVFKLVAIAVRLIASLVISYGLTVGSCLSFLASVFCGHNALFPFVVLFVVVFVCMQWYASSRRSKR